MFLLYILYAVPWLRRNVLFSVPFVILMAVWFSAGAAMQRVYIFPLGAVVL